jgi:beta-keto acid cleavage enzyme
MLSAVVGGDVVGLRAGRIGHPPRRARPDRLEDYAGSDEPSNLDLLRAAVAIAEDVGRAPATTTQARQILGVPPAARSPLAFGRLTMSRQLRRAIAPAEAGPPGQRIGA